MTAPIHRSNAVQVADSAPVLQLHAISQHFPIRGNRSLIALDSVDLSVEKGEVVGLVGESGSGKSTLARIAVGLIHPTAGSASFEGRDLAVLGSRGLRSIRQHMQMVFQDPYGALNSRMTIERLIDEPLRLHTTLSRADRRARV